MLSVTQCAQAKSDVGSDRRDEVHQPPRVSELQRAYQNLGRGGAIIDWVNKATDVTSVHLLLYVGYVILHFTPFRRKLTYSQRSSDKTETEEWTFIVIQQSREMPTP